MTVNVNYEQKNADDLVARTPEELFRSEGRPQPAPARAAKAPTKARASTKKAAPKKKPAVKQAAPKKKAAPKKQQGILQTLEDLVDESGEDLADAIAAAEALLERLRKRL